MSGAGETITGAGGLDACNVAKPVIAEGVAWEIASSIESGPESDRSGAPVDAGEGVTVGKDVDACGVGKAAATVSRASVTTPLFKPDFGSVDSAARWPDTASSGIVDGVAGGRDAGTSGVAKAVETDSGASTTASPIEPEFDPFDSLANGDDAAACRVGEGAAGGGEMDARGVAEPPITGGSASNPTSPEKAPLRGRITVSGDPVASTISA
jgi:hypothetical protein